MINTRVTTAALFSLATAFFSASSAHACKLDSCVPQQTDDGWVHEYDHTNSAMHPLPTNDGVRNRTPPTWEYRYWRCQDADSNCITTCDINDEGGVFLYMDRRAYGSTDPWELNYGDGLCLVPSDGIPREEIETRIYEYVEGRVDLPSAKIAPPDGTGIVNLPIIVWCQDQPPLNFDVENPVPGQLYAEPTYSWQFSDGDTYHGPGRAYDGTDPKHAPDDYYLAHTFSQTGSASVTLTHIWEPTFTYQGINGPAALTLDPLVLRDDAELTITEIDNVLTGNR